MAKQEFYLLENAVEDFTEQEKYIERIKRERNLISLENKQFIKEIQKREKILETLEAYLLQRIEKLVNLNYDKKAIHELQILLKALKEERNFIFSQEGRK